jgi:aminoglycoside phosphotransferase (APT) family kinase protein
VVPDIQNLVLADRAVPHDGSAALLEPKWGTLMIDVERLAAWMDERGLGAGEPLEHELVAGGTQNEIYGIRRGELHGALRIPPPTAPETRDAGIMREWRIIEALDGTDVPHTAAIAACEDQSVLGRAFYLMGYVDGWSPMNTDGWPAPFDTDLEARKGLAFELAEGIALLSKVDWQAKGLQDLGRPDGFHDRQVDRWTAFLERIKGRELPGFDVAAAWLREHRPLDFIPGLMHGDYQFANVMYRHGAPAKMAAIVDWEMGTVGDPKLDLAWVVNGWPEDPDAGEGGISYVDMHGMPSRTAMLDRYSEVSGRQVDDIDYYVVLAKWKLAVVLEQGFQRAGDDEKLQAFGDVVLDLMLGAGELAESTDYDVRVSGTASV